MKNSPDQQLRRLFYGGKKIKVSEAEHIVETDEMQALLLQISLALLMIFIIATFIFRTKLMLDYEDKFANLTPKHVSAQSKSINDTYKEREEMYAEILRLYAEAREKLGLTRWSTLDAIGNISYLTTNILDGVSVRESQKTLIVDATRYAKETLPFRKKIEYEWYDEVSRKTADKDSIARNKIWLRLEINKRIDLLYNYTTDFQEALLMEICNYYIDNPDRLTDRTLNGLIRSYVSSSESGRKRLTIEIRHKIKQYAKELLKKQGIVLLNEV